MMLGSTAMAGESLSAVVLESALLTLLLRRGADPNQMLQPPDVLSMYKCGETAPVIWWIWFTALRECGYSIAGYYPGAHKVIKSAESYTGRSVLDKDFVFRIPCLCSDETTSKESYSNCGCSASSTSDD